MSIFDRSCIWCGKQFELEAHDNDANSFGEEMKEHTGECEERPDDEKLRKSILRAIKGKDLDDSRRIIKEILNVKLLPIEGVRI